MRSFIFAAALAALASAHNHPENGVSTVTAVETDTITSCASGVESCPGKETATVPAASVTTIDVYTTTSICPESSTIVPPAQTVPSNSTISIPPAPPASTESPPANTVAPPPDTVSYTVIPITTCIPTTLYSTVPVTTSTPVAASSGFASGTGVIPQPSSSPIIPVTGAASSVSGSFAAAGVLAIAAFFL